MQDREKILSLIGSGKYALALTLLDQSLEKDRNDPEGLYNFAICCIRTQNFKKAISIAQELLEKFPKFLESDSIYKLLIFANIQTGDFNKALELAEERLKFALEDTVLLSFKAYSLEKTHRIPESIQSHQEILRIDPENLNSLNALGYLLVHNRKPSESERKLAVDCLRKALQLDPDNAAYLDSFGVLLSTLGNRKEAEKAFEKALLKAPSNGIILEHLQKYTDNS